MMPLLKKCCFTLIIAFVTGCFKLFAQDSTLIGATIQWDLQKCIEYARKNNIQINTLQLSQQVSQQEFLLAKAARLPNLSGTASQNFGHNGASGFSANGNYGLNSSVTLYNGNYINNNILQKNLEVQSANLSVIQQENDITLQITQAYLAVLLDKESIIYNTDLLNTTKAQVKLEQQRYDVGAVARKDLIQLQAQQATDQFTLISSQNLERTDLITLKQLLLLPTDIHFDVVKPDSIAAPANVVSPFRDAEQTALQNRPEVKNGELGLKIAQYSVDLANAGYKPSLIAGGSIGTGYTTGQGDLFPQFGNNFNQQVGITLSVPIFTRRVVKTQVEEAKINVKQAELNLKNTRTTLSQEVERAYINVQNAQSQYDAANEELKFSKESYRIANEQLKVSATNTVDFLLVKNQFVQAEQAFVQAKYNALLTMKIYDFYRGVPIKL
ncbi:TolC family protein [uncultured Mucilaginibacter sp.]|uniref:TolC family protein n=1 Tax=uncultured Mucilaginibacter sp. TaxID=797541 RepID=UPI0025D0CE71|nr:TolC family protein [uncultured Mucilaginibacter sp.]